jgi:hypothetical protein
MRNALLVAVVAMVLTMVEGAHAQEIDWKKVDAALGRSGAESGDVHRYGFPRSDLQVTLDGVTIRPSLALGGWVAFKPMQGHGAMVMGDLVLLETEINPVMAKLLEGGVEVTAVHNHLLRASPMTFYMHVGGHGDPVKFAEVIRSALAMSKTPLTPPVGSTPPAVDLDTAQLDQIIGVKGQANGGVYQFNVPRRDPITESGVAIPTAMGSAHAINFQPAGGGKAAITGDFVVAGQEVGPLIRALKSSGIDVTAIHSHMLTVEPRMIFVHFWAIDDAPRLAKSLRAALEKTAVAK